MVVNSTIVHAIEPEKHVVDKLNFAAIRRWFLDNLSPSAAIVVMNVDDDFR